MYSLPKTDKRTSAITKLTGKKFMDSQKQGLNNKIKVASF